MTNYEWLKKRNYGASTDGLGKFARRMYDKRLSVPTNLVVKPLDDTFERWIFEEADTALEFDIGQLVTVDTNGKPEYGIVTGYFQGNLSGCPISDVRVRTSSGEGTVRAETVKPAALPPEILELAKAQLRESCPLKEATCQA